MKIFVYIIFLYCSCVAAQNTLEGTVYLYKNKGINKPFENVYIKAEGTVPYTTKRDGYYNLAFDNTYKTARINVFKQAYEIVNTERLKAVDLSKIKQLDIYLDIEGNTEKRKRALIDTGNSALQQRYDFQLKTLAQKNDQAKGLLKILEETYKRKFADYLEASSFLSSQKDRDKTDLDALVKLIVQENLDHSNKRYNKIIEFMEKGQIDSIRKIFSPTIFLEEVEIRNEAQRKDVASAYLYITAYALPKGLYDSIDITYQGIMNTDPRDKRNFVNASLFFYNNNRLSSLNSLLKQYNLEAYKFDTSFFSILFTLKFGLAVKSNDFVSLFNLLLMLQPNVTTGNTYSLKINFIEDYNLLPYQKLIIWGIVFDGINYYTQNIAEIDSTANIDNIVNDTTFSHPENFANTLINSDSTSFDEDLLSSLVFLSFGNMYYDKKFYNIASKYYNASLEKINSLKIEARINNNLEYDQKISYNEFGSLFLNRYGLQLYLRLISCVSKSEKQTINAGIINEAEKILLQLVEQNSESNLKEEYEFYKNVGIIKLRENKTTSAKSYLNKALAKLNKLETLNSSFLNMEKEKKEIQNFLLIISKH